MQVLASQLPFLANRIAEQSVPQILWPVNCIKIGGQVALLSGEPYCLSLYCANIINLFQNTKEYKRFRPFHKCDKAFASGLYASDLIQVQIGPPRFIYCLLQACQTRELNILQMYYQKANALSHICTAVYNIVVFSS